MMEKCNSFGGKPYSPSDKNEYYEYLNSWKSTQLENSACRGGIFLGYKKCLNNSLGNFWMKEQWNLFEPNGGDSEGCVVITPKTWRLSDVSCSSRFCTSCYFENVPTFTTRGLCPDEEDKEDWTFLIDVKVKVQNISKNGFKIPSLGMNILVYYLTLQEWQVVNLLRNTTLLSLQKAPGFLPFGAENWTIRGLRCSTSDKTILLKITGVICFT